jgi:hypothetical protein
MVSLLPLLLLSAAPQLGSVLIKDVPHVQQKPDFCGEACVEMWLKHLGHAGDQDWVFDQSGLDPLLARGLWSRDLSKALTRIGFDPGPGWYDVEADDTRALASGFAALHADLARGVPSIVCMHSHDGPDATEHFRLILGYDATTDEVVFHEPAAKSGAYRRMKRPLFLKLWPLKYSADRWTLVRFKLDGQPKLAGAAAVAPTDADYSQHMMELKEKLPDGFAVSLSKPFVVVGNAGEASVKTWAMGTVAGSASRLKRQFFPKDPDEILDVWLFKDDVTYRTYATRLFGEMPDTPYGYYTPAYHALVMNIATGGGTLVHEIVHPYVRANFPEAPAWLNEGLGSLYEQSDFSDGKIVGLTNWRLAGLQEAILAGGVPPFEVLAAESDSEFYEGRHRDTSYGQSRYLMYYLQQNGLLEDFYAKFHANHVKDPTGLATLKQVLGEKDLAAFKQRWEKWVLALTFP